MKTKLSTQWVTVLILLLVLTSLSCSKGPSDESISAAIKSSYFSDPAVKNEPIDIAVDHGQVTLSGKVSSDAARLQAYKLADGTPGVKKVNDKMEVGPAVAMEAPKPESQMNLPPAPESRPAEPKADVAPAPPPPPPPR